MKDYHNWYNWYNYHSQDSVSFQHQHESAIAGFRSSVNSIRCWEQEQNPSIPDTIWRLRHNEGSNINTLLPKHDKVPAMTAIKRFHWKRIAVKFTEQTYWTPLYLVVTYDQAPNNWTEQNDPCARDVSDVPQKVARCFCFTLMGSWLYSGFREAQPRSGCQRAWQLFIKKYK